MEADLISKIESAVQAVIQKEMSLLKKGKVERTFTFSFANEIAKVVIRDGIQIDPFYNKHYNATKRLKGKVIELDIAVHERGIDEHNLVAIEIETSNSPKRDDVWKIKELTKELGGFGYMFGLYVVFGVKSKAGQIIAKEWFKNGRHFGN